MFSIPHLTEQSSSDDPSIKKKQQKKLTASEMCLASGL